MSKQSLASLAIKLMAVYVLIWTFPSVIGLGASLSQFSGDGTGVVVSGVLISIVLLLFFLGMFIWFIRHADWFSRKIVPDDEPLESLNRVSVAEVQTIAFSCIGLLVLSQSVPALVQQLSYIGAAKYADGPEINLKIFASSFSQLLSVVVQLAIGLYLFLSPRGLANLWLRLQETRPMRGS